MKKTHEEFELPSSKPQDMLDRLKAEHPDVVESISAWRDAFGPVKLVQFKDRGIEWQSAGAKADESKPFLFASQYLKLGEAAVDEKEKIANEKGKR